MEDNFLSNTRERESERERENQ